MERISKALLRDRLIPHMLGDVNRWVEWSLSTDIKSHILNNKSPLEDIGDTFDAVAWNNRRYKKTIFIN